jgi:hypothetical protein
MASMKNGDIIIIERMNHFFEANEIEDEGKQRSINFPG